MTEKRAQALINTENLMHNYKYIKSKCPSSRVIAVVKADAYGHGAVEVCRVLEENGCDMFAVATVAEGVILRENGVKGDIIILGYAPTEYAHYVAEYDMIQNVNSVSHAKELNEVGIKLRIHIKIDTGMSRLGIYCHSANETDAAFESVKEICALPNLKTEGIFTHFACADDSNSDMTERQYASFKALLDRCEKEGVSVGMRHCCNSAALLTHPEMHLDAVRAGIIIYGLDPAGNESKVLRPAMSFVTHIVQITHLSAGDTVSYGGAFTAKHDMTAATLAVGYADGMFRGLSDGEVYVNGRRVPILGKVCMDMCMVDVSSVDCSVGDRAEIFGEHISVNEQAKRIGTINYELICALKSRVPKIYV